MSTPVNMGTHKRMRPADPRTSPGEGVVYWKASKSLWYLAALLATARLAALAITPGGLPPRPERVELEHRGSPGAA